MCTLAQFQKLNETRGRVWKHQLENQAQQLDPEHQPVTIDDHNSAQLEEAYWRWMTTTKYRTHTYYASDVEGTAFPGGQHQRPAAAAAAGATATGTPTRHVPSRGMSAVGVHVRSG